MTAATTKSRQGQGQAGRSRDRWRPSTMFEKRIVRDRHSGKLVEIDMNPEVFHRRGRPGSQLRLHQRRGSSRGS